MSLRPNTAILLVYSNALLALLIVLLLQQCCRL